MQPVNTLFISESESYLDDLRIKLLWIVDASIAYLIKTQKYETIDSQILRDESYCTLTLTKDLRIAGRTLQHPARLLLLQNFTTPSDVFCYSRTSKHPATLPGTPVLPNTQRVLLLLPLKPVL